MNFIIAVKIIVTVVCTVISLIGVVIVIETVTSSDMNKGKLPDVILTSLFAISTITFALLFDFSYPSCCEKCGEPRLPHSNYCTACGSSYNVRNRKTEFLIALLPTPKTVPTANTAVSLLMYPKNNRVHFCLNV